MSLRKINFLSEVNFPVLYKELELTTDFRCDILVDHCIILELKAVQEIIPYFKAKIINHMKLAEIPKGILVNFNVVNIMKEGHHSFKNDFYDRLPD